MAQFHRAAKHKNVLNKQEISSLIKTGLPTKFLCVAFCLLLVFNCCFILKITWKFVW